MNVYYLVFISCNLVSVLSNLFQISFFKMLMSVCCQELVLTEQDVLTRTAVTNASARMVTVHLPIKPISKSLDVQVSMTSFASQFIIAIMLYV